MVFNGSTPPCRGGSPGSNPGVRSSLTVLLLNWRRPQNVLKVIEGWRAQTVRTQIFLWDNGDLERDLGKGFPAVDLYVKSSDNLVCYPRWLLGTFAKTKFICTNDDDIMVSDATLAESIIEELEHKPNDVIIGPAGMRLNNGKYNLTQYWADDATVDVIKGRMMCLHTSFLDHVFLRPGPPEIVASTEDIYISSFSDTKYVPSFFNGKLSELPAGKCGLNESPDHLKRRQRAVDCFFGRPQHKRPLELL